MREKHLKKIILSILAGGIFFHVGCHLARYTIPFVAVRESDFRIGPVHLPLCNEDRVRIESFLRRGGDWGTADIVDANVIQRYGELFSLLSDPEFLVAENFRQKTKINYVSSRLSKWFQNPIIYQMVDANRQKPPLQNPLSITDGKFWWIFFTKEKNLTDDRLEITNLLVTASLSKTMKHYGAIKESNPIQSNYHDSIVDKPIEVDADQALSADLHLSFLGHIQAVAKVKLVSRLIDERLGFSYPSDVRIFIPDLHLLGKERRKVYQYGTNHLKLLTSVAEKLKEYRTLVRSTGCHATVYQLGDFLDLWREVPVVLSKKKASADLSVFTETMVEDHSSLSSQLWDPRMNTRFVLGNHDFDLHKLENFIGSELRYYIPRGTQQGPAGVILHGDLFDWLERDVSPAIKHLVLYFMGPYVKEHTFDLTEIREMIIKRDLKIKLGEHIQLVSPVDLGNSLSLEEGQNDLNALIGKKNFNIRKVGDTAYPAADYKFAKEGKEFLEMISDETDWKMSFLVIGHTHHARIVLDESEGGFFALVDCGAWIEKCMLDGDESPNAQIGILWNNDARIYQLSPK